MVRKSSTVAAGLESLTAGLGQVDSGAAPEAQPRVNSHSAPAALLAASGEIEKFEDRIRELEKRVRDAESSGVVLSIDPATVVLSKYANRLPGCYSTPEFGQLKASIQHFGGNLIPVTVRKNPNGESQYPWEMIYGSRRRQACLDLGLQLKAVEVDLSDEEVYLLIEEENKNREGLSTYENALHYARGLETKLFKSQSELAEKVNGSQGYISVLVGIADIPEDVLAVFREPRELPLRVLEQLSRSYKSDPVGIKARAKDLIDRGTAGKGVKELLQTLTLEEPAQVTTIKSASGKTMATVKQTSRGVALSYAAKGVTREQQSEIFQRIEQLLAKVLGK